MHDPREFLDRRWAQAAGVVLLVAFLLPVNAGNQWLFFTQLLQTENPILKVVALAPLALALVALGASAIGDGVARAVALLVGVGLLVMTGIGVAETVIEVLAEAGALPVPAPQGASQGVLSTAWPFALVFAGVGLALRRTRPASAVGPRMAGAAGVALLAVHFVPMQGDKLLISLLFEGDLWEHAWPAPLALGLHLGFAGACASLLLRDQGSVAEMARGLGLAALVALPVGALIMLFRAGGGELAGPFLVMTVKFYGGMLAAWVVFGAGVLGLVQHGWVPAE